jgi:hypothetical protein
VERARQAVRDAILLRVADAQAAGVLAALAVGDQAAIDGHGQMSRSLPDSEVSPMRTTPFAPLRRSPLNKRVVL